jgi:DNA polymerase-3 subunit beta
MPDPSQDRQNTQDSRMKVICDRSALNEALSATSSVTLSRTPKPILQCIRVTAEKDLLTLTAYDQEVGLRFRVREVEVSRPGETLVTGDRLLGIVRESSDDTLSFEMTDDTLHVRGRDSHFEIYGQDVREFPPVGDLEGSPDFTVKLSGLQSAIEKTLFAAARENTRYAINGVLWEKRGNRLQLVATDGRRLALSGMSFEKTTGSDGEAIVPTKALGLIGKLHLDAEALIDIKMSANQIIMRADRATISSVLVEGRFPKYQDVVPRDFEKRIEIETEKLLSAVRRAALLTNEESKGIRISLSGEGMILSSRAPEAGAATVRLPVEYKYEPMDIGFNPSFLIEALKVCEETTVFEVQTSTKPGVFRSGNDFKYVVMPVNLS